MKTAIIIKRAICYVLGIVLICVGVNIAKMSNMGITPGTSIPRVLEASTGITLGTCIIMVYSVVVLLQIIILRKRFPLRNLLGIPLTIGYGYVVDITGIDPNALGHLLYRFPRPASYPMQVVYIAAAIFIIGAGTYLYTRPKWIPLPPEGLAGAINVVTGRKFGDCKTGVDTGMVTIGFILQLLLLGGLGSLTGKDVVIREGTFLTAIFIGQVVKLLTKTVDKKVMNLLEMENNNG